MNVIRLLILCWLLPGLVLMTATTLAQAACSRPIAAAYSTQPVADAYSAQPALHLPSLQDAIAARSGCKFTVTVDPPARAWENFNAGKIDVLMSIPPGPVSSETGIFLPILRSPWVLVTTSAVGASPETLEGFLGDRHLLVGKIRGLPYPPDISVVLDKLQQQQQIDEAVDIDMALNKLEIHRDAVVIMSAGAYLLHADRIRAAQMRHIVQTQFAPALFGIYVSRKSLDSADCDTLVAAIKTLLSERLPIKLVRAHFGGNERLLLPPD
jgi:polar amino acid transport system substrate-binding protein